MLPRVCIPTILDKNWLKNSSRNRFLTCFCQDGLNRFKPIFKPVLAETCQPCRIHLSPAASHQLELHLRNLKATAVCLHFISFDDAL